MAKICVIHGPNLNLLGKREIDVYGTTTIDEINGALAGLAKEHNADLVTFQSNHEGEIVDRIGQARSEKIDVIIMNPAAYTHTSVAIRDAVSACAIPTIEVHLSNIYAREEFRHTSLIAGVARGQISGFGKTSYELAFMAAVDILKSKGGK